jgi:hypothetical protein
MSSPRLLLLPLLIALCVATVAAQTPSDKTSDSSQAASSQGEHNSSNITPQVHTQHILTLEQNETTCYTLRTYRVARENPESDSTRPAGYSTCQPATRFQLRTAVDSPK